MESSVTEATGEVHLKRWILLGYQPSNLGPKLEKKETLVVAENRLHKCSIRRAENRQYWRYGLGLMVTSGRFLLEHQILVVIKITPFP